MVFTSNKFIHPLKTNIKRLSLFALGVVGDRLPARGIPILAYHSIDDSRSPISTSRLLFDRQMRYLQKNGYRTITLERLLRFLGARAELSRKVVSLTFDDGFKSNYDNAFPILKQYGFTATIFLVTSFIDRVIDWEKLEGIPNLPLMSWKEIKELNDYGIMIEPHSNSHPYLSQLTEEEMREEIYQSKVAIEKNLGTRAQFFAYPYGDFNDKIREIVKELGFLGACSARPGMNISGQDVYALSRLQVDTISGADRTRMLYFRSLLSGRGIWYVALRKKWSYFARFKQAEK